MKWLALLCLLSGCAVAWGDHSCAAVNLNHEPTLAIDKDKDKP